MHCDGRLVSPARREGFNAATEGNSVERLRERLLKLEPLCRGYGFNAATEGNSVERFRREGSRSRDRSTRLPLKLQCGHGGELRGKLQDYGERSCSQSQAVLLQCGHGGELRGKLSSLPDQLRAGMVYELQCGHGGELRGKLDCGDVPSLFKLHSGSDTRLQCGHGGELRGKQSRPRRKACRGPTDGDAGFNAATEGNSVEGADRRQRRASCRRSRSCFNAATEGNSVERRRLP
jgi:hypothetical protein